MNFFFIWCRAADSASFLKLKLLFLAQFLCRFNKARTEGAEHLSGALSDLTELQSLNLDL